MNDDRAFLFVMTAGKFTPKESLFIEHYLVSLNGAKAARLAGYSEGSAKEIACENLTKPHIRTEIDRRLKEKIINANEVLERLTNQATGDVTDLMELTKEDGSLDLDAVKAAGLGPLIKKVKLKRRNYSPPQGVPYTEIDTELELYDAQSALVHLGRYHELFTDKVKTLDDERLKKLQDELAEIRRRRATGTGDRDTAGTGAAGD